MKNNVFSISMNINFTNATNAKIVADFCKKNHINFTVSENASLPQGIDEGTVQKNDVKVSKNTKSKLGAKDVTVQLVATKSLVKIDGAVSKDTYAVLKNDADALNGAWDKDAKAFKFNAMTVDGKKLSATAVAKKFAERTVVTGSERDAVRKDWGWA